MTASSTSLGLFLVRDFHLRGGRGGMDIVLLLIGLAFAGVLVWVIERSGKRTT